MKKAFLILIILSYSLATLGVSLKEFYCCGKLKSITVTVANTDSKRCAQGDNTKGCCDTKYHFYKVKDSHVAQAETFAPAKVDIAHLPCFGSSPLISTALFYGKMVYGNHAPPIYQGVPLYISNCVFRV